MLLIQELETKHLTSAFVTFFRRYPELSCRTGPLIVLTLITVPNRDPISFLFRSQDCRRTEAASQI